MLVVCEVVMHREILSVEEKERKRGSRREMIRKREREKIYI